ncbi:MAG TPA: hypothetical protein VIH76_07400 [Candidatus Acidoferrales bacterium]
MTTEQDITTVEYEQLAEAVRTNHPRACEALSELERRLLDLRMAHKCDRPLKHMP